MAAEPADGDDGDVERAISLFISQEDIGHTVEESGSLL
eukprot:COSAG04_NODE_19681_length_410_cov_1.090032_1_plen_37_part_10